MPRSAAQSDFVVVTSAVAPAAEELEGPIGDGFELPRAKVRTTQASARATRIVMTLTLIVLGALFLLTLIGPHIPSGE